MLHWQCHCIGQFVGPEGLSKQQQQFRNPGTIPSGPFQTSLSPPEAHALPAQPAAWQDLQSQQTLLQQQQQQQCGSLQSSNYPYHTVSIVSPGQTSPPHAYSPTQHQQQQPQGGPCPPGPPWGLGPGTLPTGYAGIYGSPQHQDAARPWEQNTLGMCMPTQTQQLQQQQAGNPYLPWQQQQQQANPAMMQYNGLMSAQAPGVAGQGLQHAMSGYSTFPPAPGQKQRVLAEAEVPYFRGGAASAAVVDPDAAKRQLQAQRKEQYR